MSQSMYTSEAQPVGLRSPHTLNKITPNCSRRPRVGGVYGFMTGDVYEWVVLDHKVSMDVQGQHDQAVACGHGSCEPDVQGSFVLSQDSTYPS